MNTSRMYDFILKPWVTLTCLLLGLGIGVGWPELGLRLTVAVDLYVDLLKMVVLPFMVSAVVFSLQRLFHDGGASRIMGRMVTVFAGFAVLAALIGLLTLTGIQPGDKLPPSTITSFGHIIESDRSSLESSAVKLYGEDAEQRQVKSVEQIVLNILPSNIFEALAKGESLKALVFALLFGSALGGVPNRLAGGLSQALETVYSTCHTLSQWLCLPLPVVLVCMSASQIAKSGLEPLLAMAQFLLAFIAASLLFLSLALMILWKRGNCSLVDTIHALREPFALAIATGNSATCMPAMIKSLAHHMSFSKIQVELLVPLSVSLLRLGPIIYYACATLFIAQVYGRSLSGPDFGLLMVACILAGFASTGMTGVVTASLTSITCSYLGLPFEAVFILFLAIDPICDMFRNLVLVIGNTAAVALICPRPLKI